MKFLFLTAFLFSCSQSATLAVKGTETIPVDNSVDSGELEDTAG